MRTAANCETQQHDSFGASDTFKMGRAEAKQGRGAETKQQTLAKTENTSSRSKRKSASYGATRHQLLAGHTALPSMYKVTSKRDEAANGVVVRTSLGDLLFTHQSLATLYFLVAYRLLPEPWIHYMRRLQLW